MYSFDKISLSVEMKFPMVSPNLIYSFIKTPSLEVQNLARKSFKSLIEVKEYLEGKIG